MWCLLDLPSPSRVAMTPGTFWRKAGGDLTIMSLLTSLSARVGFTLFQPFNRNPSTWVKELSVIFAVLISTQLRKLQIFFSIEAYGCCWRDGWSHCKCSGPSGSLILLQLFCAHVSSHALNLAPSACRLFSRRLEMAATIFFLFLSSMFTEFYLLFFEA